MQALLRTTRIETAAPAQRAGLEAARSRHDHQKGRPTCGALPHGHGIYPRQSNPAACTSRPPSRDSSGKLMGRASLAAPIHFIRAKVGANRTCAQSLPAQQLSQGLANRHHSQSRLSSFAVSVGIDPNENGLTYEAQPLPPDGKAYD